MSEGGFRRAHPASGWGWLGMGALVLSALVCSGCSTDKLDAALPTQPATDAGPTAPTPLTPSPELSPTPEPSPTAAPARSRASDTDRRLAEDAPPGPPPTADTAAAQAFEAARQMLAQKLGIDPLAITEVQTTPAQWPDGCLGLARAGEMCTMSIVPGFRVVLQAEGREYTARTNRSGRSVRFEGAGALPKGDRLRPRASGLARALPPPTKRRPQRG